MKRRVPTGRYHLRSVQGSFIKHVANESGAKVLLKGRGSGLDGQETTEPLHFLISSSRQDNITKGNHYNKDSMSGSTDFFCYQARGLAESLAAHVKTEYEEYKAKKSIPRKHNSTFVMLILKENSLETLSAPPPYPHMPPPPPGYP